MIFAANPEQETSNDPAFAFGGLQWSTKYAYDAVDNLSSKKDTRGTAPNFVTINYSYDALNRLFLRTYSDGTPPVTLEYDAPAVPNSKGRTTRVSSSVSTYDYLEYDALGRVLSSKQTTGGQIYTMGYEYDLAGNMISETYPSGRKVTMAFDTAGRLSLLKAVKERVNGQIVDVNKTYASSFSYTSHDAVSAVQLGNNKWEHAKFNSRFQPIEIGLGVNSTDFGILKLEYGYGGSNNNGNVLSQRIVAPGLDITQNYVYDELNRLKTASEGANWTQNYLYDRYGNRAVAPGSFIPNTTLTPQSLGAFNPATNRINASQYDRAGNQTADAAGSTFQYDAENRQISCTVSGATSTYAYDGDGRRVSKTVGTVTTIFVYNVAGQLIAEYNNSTPPPPEGGTSYLTTDHLGSTRVVTDASGNVKSRRDYLPFGEELGVTIGDRTTGMGYGVSDGLRQSFTQKERDSESGVDYFLARYYSGHLGRFAGVDPENAGADVENPQSWNGYTYAGNNPLIYIDPTGTDYILFGPDGKILHVRDKFFNQLPEGYEIVYQNTEGTYIELKDPEGNIWKGDFYPASDFKDRTEDFDYKIFDVLDHMSRTNELRRRPFLEHLHNGQKHNDPFKSTSYFKKSDGQGGGSGTPREFRKPKPGLSGKEGAKDIPSWAKAKDHIGAKMGINSAEDC